MWGTKPYCTWDLYSVKPANAISEKASGQTYPDAFSLNFLSSRPFFPYIAEMLLTTNQSITEIVTSVGYKNNAYFYQHFRNMFGCSPLEYREQNHAMALL